MQEEFQSRLGEFVRELPRGVEYAVETRNPAYLNRSYFEFLLERGLSPVFLQGYYMPSITGVYREWRPLVREQERVVIRLHGPGRKDMEELTGERWDRIVDPRDGELREVADMVNDLVQSGVLVYLNVNNHYEGSAPLNIERVEKLLSG